MENTPAFHPLDHVSVLRRRMWWLITPLVLAVLIGGALIMVLPRIYGTTATLGISLPTMNGQVVSDAQRLTPQERVRSFNQLLLSPLVLERVIKEEGIDKTMPLNEAIGMIGGNASVTLPPLDPTIPQGTVELFYLNFKHENPDLAARIANRLAEVFIDESAKKRTLRAEETSAFLSERVKESQTRLAELESQLRVAKEAHKGSLPEQTQSNVAVMTASQQQLMAASNALRAEQDRLLVLEREIGSSNPTMADPADPGRSAAAPGLSPATVRVLTLEKELAARRLVVTDKHPDVINLQTELARAKAEAAEEVVAPAERREAQLRSDPAYAALLREREQVKLNIASLQRQTEAYNAQIGRYMSRVDTAPRVEQQLASLQRETDHERARYALLVQRVNEAQIAERVEQSRGSEHFTIVSRAAVPEEPTTPLGPIPRLMAFTLLLGLCLGGASALGREYLDRSIHDARALNDLDVPVIGEIPRISHV
jgi:polysaccharide chain length determinant protein (PEP-CTERM system associated)